VSAATTVHSSAPHGLGFFRGGAVLLRGEGSFKNVGRPPSSATVSSNFVCFGVADRLLPKSGSKWPILQNSVNETGQS